MCKISQKDTLEQLILICLNTERFFHQFLVESLQRNTVFLIDKKYLKNVQQKIRDDYVVLVLLSLTLAYEQLVNFR